MKTMKSALDWLAPPAATAMLIGFFGGTAQAGDFSLPFNASNFKSPRNNTYLPMAIGKTYVYMAEEEDGLIVNEITHTSKKKKILGVATTIVRDVEWVIVEGVGVRKTEETTDWIAWDKFGNVWYFGEDTTEFLYDEDWNLTGTSKAGSWQAGVDGAQPGLLMLANPTPGTSYRQEYYAGVAEDMAQVVNLGESVSVEFGDFENCLKTKEWTPLNPGAIEHKFYAPRVGLVYIEGLKGKTVKTQLVDVR